MDWTNFTDTARSPRRAGEKPRGSHHFLGGLVKKIPRGPGDVRPRHAAVPVEMHVHRDGPFPPGAPFGLGVKTPDIFYQFVAV
jgi:hypothetical protein